MQILASQCLACCTSGKGNWFSNNTTGIAAFMLLFLEITWPSKSGFYSQKSGYCGPSIIHHIQWASPSSHNNNLRLYSPGTASELWLSLENEWISPGQRTGRKIWKTEKERATTDSWREQREKQRYGRFNTRVGIHMKAWANAHRNGLDHHRGELCLIHCKASTQQMWSKGLLSTAVFKVLDHLLKSQ